MIWVLLGEKAEKSAEKVFVGDDGGVVVLPDSSSLLHVTDILDLLGLWFWGGVGGLILLDVECGELGGKLVVSILWLLRLLLLLHGQVESVSSVGVLSLLRLFLLLHARKHGCDIIVLCWCIWVWHSC